MKNQLRQPCQLGSGTIAADLTALLGESKHFRHQEPGGMNSLLHLGPYRGAGSISRIDRTKQRRLFRRKAREIGRKILDYRQNAAFHRRACSSGAFDHGDALVSERGKHVFFGGEVVKKGPFADVGGIGDVLDGGFQIAALGKQLERGVEKPLAGFGPVTFSAARRRPAMEQGPCAASCDLQP